MWLRAHAGNGFAVSFPLCGRRVLASKRESNLRKQILPFWGLENRDDTETLGYVMPVP